MAHRILAVALASLGLCVADVLISRDALAQTDPATQRLIDQLRPRMGSAMATRGLMRPTQGVVAPEPPASAPVDVGISPASTRLPPARPPSTPATTAPADVPAASLTVNFAIGSVSLLPGAFAPLNALGRALNSRDLAESRFRIEGHTDTVGSTEENRALSERRAIVVRDYLVEHFNISPQRLVIEGLGESQLLVPTPDETPQPRNRRVQVLNIGS